MANFFHRLTAPAYFLTGGGTTFPVEAGVTYDYINNLAAGTPSNADDAKVGGPNDGSYFVAFGEDATSNNANRPNKALAQNCDYFDDVLHRSIATAVVSPTLTSDGTSTHLTKTLLSGTYLGTGTVANTQAGLKPYFELVDSSDNEIINNTTGAKVAVTSVTLGGSDTLGSDAFATASLTVTFTEAVPNGVAYKLYYGQRANLALLPVDALTNIKIRGAQEIASDVENVFRLLHGNSLAWNATWTSDVYKLAQSGLDDRYRRRATAAVGTVPDTYFGLATALDTAGSGAWISRDGPALTVVTPNSGLHHDPINALFVGKFADTTFGNSGGTTGLVVYGSRQSATITGESTYTPGYASLLSLWTHTSTTAMHATSPYTRVPAGATVVLTSPNTDANIGEAVVTLQSGNYFRNGSLQSMIAVGYDMLEIQYTQSGVSKRETMVIVAHGSSATASDPAQVRVRYLDGKIPNWTSPSTGSATITKWHSLTFGVGDGAGIQHNALWSSYATAVKLDGLFYQVPPEFDNGGGHFVRTPAAFSAQAATSAKTALQWGGFQFADPSGPVFTGSGLMGDGSIFVQGASVGIRTANGDIVADGSSSSEGALKGNYSLLVLNTLSTITTPVTQDLDMSSGSMKRVPITATDTLAVTFTFSKVRTGGVYIVLVDHSDVTSVGTITLTWPTTHFFSGGTAGSGTAGDAQPGVGVGRDMWVGYAFSATEIHWTVTRY